MGGIAFIALCVMALASCKVHVIALQGGEVQSIASGTCLEQTNCVHEITDTNYTESFTAVSADGYQFVKWHGDSRFLRYTAVSGPMLQFDGGGILFL